jgi:hypothetical protein
LAREVMNEVLLYDEVGIATGRNPDLAAQDLDWGVDLKEVLPCDREHAAHATAPATVHVAPALSSGPLGVGPQRLSGHQAADFVERKTFVGV